MPLHFICNHCGASHLTANTRTCAHCNAVLCHNCPSAHQILTHPESIQIEPIINQHHIQCATCTSEGFRSDMMECMQEGALLCNETCFNRHLEEIHQMKGAALAPGVFKVGGRLDITQKRVMPKLPRARTAEEIEREERNERCSASVCHETAAFTCGICETSVCAGHWVDECSHCQDGMCSDCYSEHDCPNRITCARCEDEISQEDGVTCDFCDDIRCEECHERHRCPNRSTCNECNEHFHIDDTNARECATCSAIMCSEECFNRHEVHPENRPPAPSEISVAHAQTDDLSVGSISRAVQNTAPQIPTRCETCNVPFTPSPAASYRLEGREAQVCGPYCFNVLSYNTSIRRQNPTTNTPENASH